jgi:hypothetical protein
VRLDSTLALVDWGNWAVTADGVVLLERRDGETRLVRLDPATGTRTPLTEALGAVPEREPALAVARDERRIVLARTDRIESTLVLVEPFE